MTPIKNRDNDSHNIDLNNHVQLNNINNDINNENQNANIDINNYANNETNSALRRSLRKSLYPNINQNGPSSNLNMKLCHLHNNRPLEILCLDHNLRLCSNCALFGEHKNHNIINEEDYIKELEIKAEVLIDFFELIDKNCSNLDFLKINDTININNNTNVSKNQNSAVENLEKAILGIEKIDKFGIKEEATNLNGNNINQSENNINNRNTTIDITNNISTNSINHPKDLFEDLALKSNKKLIKIKTKIDKYFEELKKSISTRQKKLSQKVVNFFDQINNKINAYSNTPNDLTMKSDYWKQNVKNYFEILNEISEKDDVIFKIIDSKINSQDFISSAEQIMDEYIKLKNFPFKDLSEVIDNVSIDMHNYEEENKCKNFYILKRIKNKKFLN